mgnify:CR=1 FL=1
MPRLFVLLIVLASPAFAQGSSIAIPEPGDAALFVLAVAGLLIGRHSSRRSPRRPDDQRDDD